MSSSLNEFMLQAAIKGDLEQVNVWLDAGANVHFSKLGWTPLMRASRNGHTEVARLLLERGAELEAKDPDGRTSLMWAAFNGHTEVVCLLLDRGADIEARDKDDWTPLIWASSYGHTEVFRLLLDRGADIEARDKHCRTPLMWAAFNGYTEVFRLLLERGADLDVAAEGDTAESMAHLYGHAGVVDLIRAERARRALLEGDCPDECMEMNS